MSLEGLHPELAGHKEIRSTGYMNLLPVEEQDSKNNSSVLRKEISNLGSLEYSNKFLNWSASRLGCYVQDLYGRILEKIPYEAEGGERETLMQNLDSVVNGRLAPKLRHNDKNRQNISQIYKTGAIARYSCVRLIEEVAATPVDVREKYEEREPNDSLQTEVHRWLQDNTGKVPKPDSALIDWLKRHEDTQLGVDIWGYMEEKNLYLPIQVKSLGISQKHDDPNRRVLLPLSDSNQVSIALGFMKKYEQRIDVKEENKYPILSLSNISKLYPDLNILPALYVPTSPSLSNSQIKFKDGEPTNKLVQVFQRDLNKILYR